MSAAFSAHIAVLAFFQAEKDRLDWKADTLRLYGALDSHHQREDRERRAEGKAALSTALAALHQPQAA